MMHHDKIILIRIIFLQLSYTSVYLQIIVIAAGQFTIGWMR